MTADHGADGWYGGYRLADPAHILGWFSSHFVKQVKLVSKKKPEDLDAPSAASDSAPVDSLRLSGCPSSDYDGDYDVAGEANGRPHWSNEQGMHLYWSPREEEPMWLLRSVFDPSSGSCTAFCDSSSLLDSPVPAGVERWQWVSFDPMVGAAGIQWEEHELTIERVPPTVEQAAVALLTKGIRVTRYTMVPGRPVDGGQPRPGTRCAEHLLRLSSGQDSLQLDAETIPIEVISSVIYGPASPTLDRMRASETLAPLVAPCDCFAVSSSQAGVETSYDFAALDARSARAVVIVLALLKSGRTFSGMLLWHGAQMRLRSLACGLGPQTFSTGPASSVLQMRARERALAAVLRQTAEEIEFGEEPSGGAVDAPPVPPPSIPSLMDGADGLLSSGDEFDDGPIAPPGKLPPGWDVVEASAGVFYVNSVTNTAQKEFPTVSALPPGWDIVVSSTGEEYYMNMDTGQRSSELPMADVDAGGQLAAPSIGGAPPAPAPEPEPVATSGAARDVFKLDMRPGVQAPVRKSRALQLAMKLRQRQEEQARQSERDVAAAPGADRPDEENENEISVSVDEMRAIEEDAQKAAEQAGGGAGRPAVPARRPPMVPKSKPPSRPAPQAPSRKPPSRPAPRRSGGSSGGSPGPSSPSRRPPQRPAPSVAPPGIGDGGDNSDASPGSRAPPKRKPPSTPKRAPPSRPK